MKNIIKNLHINYLIIIIFSILIRVIHNTLLVFPLKSFKKDNPDVYYKNKKYSEFLSKDFNGKTIINNWSTYSIYSELEIGDPKIKYISTINNRNSEINCFYLSKYQIKNNINYYNISKTIINKEKIIKNKEYEIFEYEGVIDWIGWIKDDLYITFLENYNSNNYTQKKINFPIYTSISYKAKTEYEFNNIEINNLNITTIFNIPIQIGNNLANCTTYCLLSYLKENKFITNFDMKVEYYNNYDISNNNSDLIGRILIGTFENLYEKDNITIKKEVKFTKLLFKDFTPILKIFISKNYIEIFNEKTKTYDEIPIESENIEFLFDTYIIEGVDHYRNLLLEHFFNKYENGKMCSEIRFKPSEYYSSHSKYIFECNTELINKHKYQFPKLKFYNSDLDTIFEFSYSELFKEVNNYTYFLVIFPTYENTNWKMGKIFLQKYPFYFNLYSKTLKIIHSDDEHTYINHFNIIFIIIAGITFLFIFAFICYKIGKICNQKRKIRAQELDENYDYTSNYDKDKEMNLIN